MRKKAPRACGSSRPHVTNPRVFDAAAGPSPLRDATHRAAGVARQLRRPLGATRNPHARGTRGKDDMQRPVRIAAAMVGTVVMLAALSGVTRADTKSTVEEIRKELMQLPYY